MTKTILRLSLFLLACSALAQEQTPDSHTLLLLHFNNDVNGASGETPSDSSGVAFEQGVFGSGAYFPPGNFLRYLSSGNIDSKRGTLEFWIKPRWGSDGQGHFALHYGSGGGMLFGKDGGNTWRMILNRFGSGGPEAGAGIANQFQAGTWHHAAFTWSAQALKLYVDGQLRTQTTLIAPLNNVTDSRLQIGADGSSSYLDAVLDELRISDVDRSPEEIANSFLAGVKNVSNLTMDRAALEMFPGWSESLGLTAQTEFGTLTIPSSAVAWESSNPQAVTVDSNGRVTAIAGGSATVRATFKGMQTEVAVTVRAAVRPQVNESLDPFLTTPAAGALYDVPVVVIRYLPTRNGTTLDASVAGTDDTIDHLKSQIDRYDIEIKYMLEEGSRFHGYKDPNAPPSLGYRVLALISIYEDMPPGFPSGSPGITFPDYNQILNRIDARHFVDDLGVKEFWLWGYHYGSIAPVESDMSSPTTGDISNSYRTQDDMPVFHKTYTLYNYNFTRSSNEAVHDHGHQLEAILGYVNRRQDGNTNLFWKQFVGQDASGHFTTGRCGWTHMPPNTTSDYDYNNATLVESDCEDWTPAGTGAKKLINDLTWGSLRYAWPRGVPEDVTQHQWYVYWMQNMPGAGNQIALDDQHVMTNWWRFTANWDDAIQSGIGLYGRKTPPRRHAAR